MGIEKPQKKVEPVLMIKKKKKNPEETRSTSITFQHKKDQVTHKIQK